MPSPKPLTLNFSGGISLGAYMAGVFYELTREAVKPRSRIVIDIITGASAGAMTSIMAAYYLLGGNPEFEPEDLLQGRAEDSIFYRAWVEQANIQRLDSIGLEPQWDPRSKRQSWSLLSGRAIERIAAMIGSAPRLPDTTKPLALLITLTNLQGLLKKTPFGNGQIKAISHAETRRFLLHPQVDLAKFQQIWDKVILTGRASGAFPVAFPPIQDDSNMNSVNLKNLSDDYFVVDGNQKKLSPLLGEIRLNDTELLFSYSDGGILDGLPIGKGIALEKDLRSGSDPNETLDQSSDQSSDQAPDQTPTQNQDSNLDEPDWQSDPQLADFQPLWRQLQQQLQLNWDDRLYVYVQPTPVDNLNSQSRLRQGFFNMIEVGLSGLTLPRNEQDAIRLNEIRARNQDFRRKQAFATILNKAFQGQIPDFVQDGLEDAIPYQHIQLSRIDPSLIGRIHDSKDPALVRQQPELARLQILQPLYDALPSRIKECLAPDTGDVKKLLASDFLFAFGGFFDQRYRDHDFLLGRLSGLTWLQLNCPSVATTPDQAAAENWALNQQVNDLVPQIMGRNSRILVDLDPSFRSLRFGHKLQLIAAIVRGVAIAIIEARSPIVWAIVGLVLLLLALGVYQLIALLLMALGF